MRSSMRTITDVNIDGRAVDLEVEGTLSFTNNCDSLSYIVMDFYDMDSHRKSSYTYGDGVTDSWQRGEKVAMSLKGLTAFSAGHDYMCVPTIYQSQPNAPETESSPAKFDVYMGAGRVQQDSSSAAEIYLDRDISFIREPVRKDSKLAGGCIVRLNDRLLLIESYDPTTGKATVSGGRINGKTYSARKSTRGESYKLVTNYLVCDAFCFYCRTEPTLELSCEITPKGIEVTGVYGQAEGVALQSWKMWGKYTHYVSPITIEHEPQYTYTIEDVFPLVATPGDSSAENIIYCEITTQDGYTKIFEKKIYLEDVQPLDVRLTSLRTVDVDFFPEGSGMFVWRFNAVGSGAVVDRSTLRYAGESSTGSFSDITAAHNASYLYHAVVVTAEGKIYMGYPHTHDEWGQEILTTYKETDLRWSLRRLRRTGAHTYRDASKSYTFSIDVTPSAIETVTGSAAYGSEWRFPKYIRGTDRYDTGSFTAILSTAITADTVEEWQDFIAEGPFLLKTDSGDVKIVEIVGDPARQYGSSLAELGITRVTYSWVEVDDIRTAVIW